MRSGVCLQRRGVAEIYCDAFPSPNKHKSRSSSLSAQTLQIYNGALKESKEKYNKKNLFLPNE